MSARHSRSKKQRLHRVSPKMQREWAEGISQWVIQREVARSNHYFLKKFGIIKGNSSEEWKEGIQIWLDQGLLNKSWKWKASKGKFKPSKNRRRIKRLRSVISGENRLRQKTDDPNKRGQTSYVSANSKAIPVPAVSFTYESEESKEAEEIESLEKDKEENIKKGEESSNNSEFLEKQMKPRKNSKLFALGICSLVGTIVCLVYGLGYFYSEAVNTTVVTKKNGETGNMTHNSLVYQSDDEKRGSPINLVSEPTISPFGSFFSVKEAGGLEMLWVEPGTFTMGSPTTESGRSPSESQHQVTLTKGFYLGKYEVTQGQYEAVMTGNPRGLSATPSKWHGNSKRPVEGVNWWDIEAFLFRLNSIEKSAGRLHTGWKYVLPTEAQWEYACRAGTSTAYSFGDSINASHVNHDQLIGETTNVGEYAANAWGFYDMHGNVWEWTSDWYQATAKTSDWCRVLRGGSWSSDGRTLRSAYRRRNYENNRHTNGFRVSFQLTETLTVNHNATVQLEMLWVEPGTFTMGSPTTEAGRGTNETEHNVTLTQGFYLGKYEVTQAQYEAVMTGNTDGLSATPSQWRNNPNHPVEKVSWEDVQIFLSRLNSQQSANLSAGWKYVLPTEAQWEYACRAGTNTAYSWGNDINSSRGNYNWDGGAHDGKDFKQTRDVGLYAANPWGFFDMHGNVWEWTADWYGATYPTGNPVVDPTVPASGSNRVVRGGSWLNDGANMRSARRSRSYSSHRYNGHIGFRVGFQFIGEYTADLNDSVQLEMLWVEPGTFTIGSPPTEVGRGSNEIEHNVTLTKGFYLGKYEVTQAQYEAVMTGNTDGLNANPSQWPNNPNRPVEKVSWADAQIFLTRLNAQQSANIPTGWAYVLPTESQWEYACRAGTTTAYSWGNDINSTRANYNWDGRAIDGNDFKQTRDVGQYNANPWGFFDMHGNVWEWTAERYQAAYPTGNPVVDPTGPASGSNRVRRGGSWSHGEPHLRSARRYGYAPSRRHDGIGFRVGFQSSK